MKQRAIAVLLMVLLCAASMRAQGYVPIPWGGVPPPGNTATDASGNIYSFTSSALIRTSANGVATTLATSQAAPPPLSNGQAQGPFIFTSVQLDQAGNVYAAES